MNPKYEGSWIWRDSVETDIYPEPWAIVSIQQSFPEGEPSEEGQVLSVTYPGVSADDEHDYDWCTILYDPLLGWQSD